jgi:hypothetical protein
VQGLVNRVIELTRIILVLLPPLVVATAMEAQDRPLNVEGTASYNLIWNGTTQASDRVRFASARFGGRVAIRLASHSYVGVSIGSWSYRVAREGFTDIDDAVSTAVAASAYLQVYPVHSPLLFFRAGAGYARTLTYYPHFDGIRQEALVHPTVSGGVGTDVSIATHLAFTPSIDLTQLFGTEGEREIRSGVVLGIGITIR